MKKFLLVAAVLFLASIPANAQDTYPRVEVFGGYSYNSVDLNIDFDDNDDDLLDFDEREGLHGVGFSIAGNFSRSVGLVGDFSYNKKSVDFLGGDVDSSTFIFLFGPRFSARGSAVTGFGHVLVGGTRFKVEDFDSDTGLTIGVGGGLDVNIGNNFAVRVGQLDYLPTRINGEWLNNFRYQAGIVIRGGNK